jgi:hypothetical protein
MCDCDPAARHSLNCPDTPIFRRILQEAAQQPDYIEPLDSYPNPFWWDRWVCFNRGEPHWGSSINGPTHWCDGRMVMPGEDPQT